MKRVLFCLALILAIGACADPPPESGYVRDKKFVAAHWEGGYVTKTRPAFKCHTESNYDYNSKSYRSEQVCGTETESYSEWEDHHDWVPDRWLFKLEECNTGKSKKCRSGWRVVPENSYDDYQVGQHYPDPA